VGGVSSGGGLPGGATLAAAQVGSAVSVQMLDASLQMMEQLTAQLMESMRAASPAGSGGSVDTWA
jgi:hypothetical protein